MLPLKRGTDNRWENMPANKLQLDKKLMNLAWLDFQNMPASEIQKELNCTHSHLTELRKNPLYHEFGEEIKEAWRSKILAMPGTNELCKKISYAVGISVHKLIDILASKKSSNKDIISAARLIAQMDGRFLGRDNVEGEELRHAADTDSLASELVSAIERQKKSIQ